MPRSTCRSSNGTSGGVNKDVGELRYFGFPAHAVKNVFFLNCLLEKGFSLLMAGTV